MIRAAFFFLLKSMQVVNTLLCILLCRHTVDVTSVALPFGHGIYLLYVLNAATNFRNRKKENLKKISKPRKKMLFHYR